MIMRTAAAFALPAAFLTACATTDAAPEPNPTTTSAATLTPVAPGCEPTAGIRWSKPSTDAELIKVTLFGEQITESDSTVVLDKPFTTSITQVAAPQAWTAALAASLGKEIGRTVKTGTAATGTSRHLLLSEGQDDPAIPELLLYETAETITATFTVGCATPVTGTLTAWTSATAGSVTCGSRREPAEALGRLARAHCPRTAAPDGSARPDIRLPDDMVGASARTIEGS
ncbi:hypothetical protein FB565_008705 [Actinoplanes lutulentus]|uniref:Lipoprotein n=1 Tax=Actinoplanes lutulentus TaxID=1287878 RepID=A0A327YZA6_9ACTN|nr:hypothetical protein [Actinoplanes lutulentus]MBB2948919.1 hypothetical protein [Actinoplanes lutulentus]RAK26298.1 hypothetical protein B0I29_128148 [Actinoplanes lutulentus]